MKYSLVIFDWDGTLADTTWRIVHCFQKAATDLHLPEPDAAAIKDCIGLDLPHTIRALFPDLSNSHCSVLQERYWQYFNAQDIPSVQLFDGVVDALSALKEKGFRLAVATGKSRHGLDVDIEHTGLAGIFEATITADEAPSKPNPQMLLDLLERLDVSPGDAIMIGDSVYDIEMAHAVKMDAVGVTYGCQSKESLEALSPKALVDDIQALLPLLTD